MKQRRMVWLLSASLAAVAAGCDGTQNVNDPSERNRVAPILELRAQARPPIPDLPVPIGFRLDEGKSRTFEAGGARYIDHVYRGGADKFTVARFFKKQMQISRWTLMASMFVQGNIRLDFEKGAERCSITITDGDLFNKTHVKMQLWVSRPIQPNGG